MTEASRPHVICDASNLLVDPARMSHARCPKFRPAYLCHSNTYHHYTKGAFGLACGLRDLRLEDFPKDHLRDIMDGMSEVEDKDMLQVFSADMQANLLSCGLYIIVPYLRHISTILRPKTDFPSRVAVVLWQMQGLAIAVKQQLTDHLNCCLTTIRALQMT